MVVYEERTIFNGSLPLNAGIFQDQHKTLNMVFANFQYENAFVLALKKDYKEPTTWVGVLRLP
jgi:hypothetical protein